jgi:hypothetical protein
MSALFGNEMADKEMAKKYRMIGLTQGIALACGQVCDMGHPQIAKDILENAGMLSRQELINNEVDDMDIEKLAGILKA